MATSTEVREEGLTAPATGPAPGVPLVPLVLAVVVAVVVAVAGVGGALYWMARSGRLPMGGGKQPAEVATLVAPKTHALVLDPLLVNLADQDGAAYLRVSMTLRVLDDIPVKGEKAEEKPEKGKVVNVNEAAVRDTALAVIGKMSSADLLNVEGKEKLKVAMSAAIAEHVPELKVKDIFFTEYLVQQ